MQNPARKHAIPEQSLDCKWYADTSTVLHPVQFVRFLISYHVLNTRNFVSVRLQRAGTCQSVHIPRLQRIQTIANALPSSYR